MSQIVIGGGPSGLRAAARLPSATLLESGKTPGGLAFPQLPEDRGLAGSTDAPQVEAAYGAAPSIPPEGLSRAVRLGGHTLTLPMGRRALLAALPKADLPALVQDLVRARAKIATERLIGGGKEERSYSAWVAYRYGETAFKTLYAPYARARFGDPDQVNVSAARLHHAVPEDPALVGLGSSPAEGWRTLGAKVKVQTGVTVRGLELRGGKVGRILTEDGAMDVDGTLWVAAAPPQVAAWLGEQLPDRLRWQMQQLTGRCRVQIALRRTGAGEDLPSELHILDPAPFFRVQRPELRFADPALQDLLLVDLSLAADDPRLTGSDAALVEEVVQAMGQLGLPAVEATGALVRRLPDYDPSWTGPWHPKHVAATRALQAIGVRLVGRAALHRYVDPGQELALVEGLTQDAEEVHELHRTLLDPPVALDDRNSPLVRFVER